MATVTCNTGITFDSLKEEILTKFEQLHKKLDERKQIVMGKLLVMQEEAERNTE